MDDETGTRRMPRRKAKQNAMSLLSTLSNEETQEETTNLLKDPIWMDPPSEESPHDSQDEEYDPGEESDDDYTAPNNRGKVKLFKSTHKPPPSKLHSNIDNENSGIKIESFESLQNVGSLLPKISFETNVLPKPIKYVPYVPKKTTINPPASTSDVQVKVEVNDGDDNNGSEVQPDLMLIGEEDCDVSPSDVAHLPLSEEDAKNEPVIYKCKTCDSNFKDKDGLEGHFSYIRCTKPFRCHLCAFLNPIYQKFLMHLKTEHGKGIHYPCSCPQKSFSSYSELFTHAKICRDPHCLVIKSNELIEEFDDRTGQMVMRPKYFPWSDLTKTHQITYINKNSENNSEEKKTQVIVSMISAKKVGVRNYIKIQKSPNVNTMNNKLTSPQQRNGASGNGNTVTKTSGGLQRWSVNTTKRIEPIPILPQPQSIINIAPIEIVPDDVDVKPVVGEDGNYVGASLISVPSDKPIPPGHSPHALSRKKRKLGLGPKSFHTIANSGPDSPSTASQSSTHDPVPILPAPINAPFNVDDTQKSSGGNSLD